jgi:hypothetical protein
MKSEDRIIAVIATVMILVSFFIAMVLVGADEAGLIEITMR